MAFFEFTANQRARAFRRDQDHVDVGTRLDLSEMDVESVREQQRRMRLDVRRDDVFVQFLLRHVRGQYRHQIGVFDRICRFSHGQAVGFGLDPARTVLAHADHHIQSGVMHVQGMRPALAAIADDGDFLVFQSVDGCFRFC